MWRTSCRYCGRSGTAACGLCTRTAVADDLTARQATEVVKAWLASQGMAFNRPNIPVRLRRFGPFSSRMGYTRVFGWGFPGIRPWLRVHEIGIARDLPRVFFQSVAAHELSHAWLADQRIITASKEDEEGFCGVVEHRWLSRFRSPEAERWRRAIETNPDGVYGDGFRRMYRLSQGRGFRGLLAHMRVRSMSPAPSALERILSFGR